MKISTRTRYGTKALMDIALHQSEEPVSLKDVAGRQQIPQHYLEQMMSRLTSADLVRTTRGPRGGVSLARPPQQIVMSEVLRILEGTNSLTECIETPELCPGSEACVTRDLWREMNQAMNQVLESTTLQDLVDRHKIRNESNATMYYI